MLETECTPAWTKDKNHIPWITYGAKKCVEGVSRPGSGDNMIRLNDDGWMKVSVQEAGQSTQKLWSSAKTGRVG